MINLSVALLGFLNHGHPFAAALHGYHELMTVRKVLGTAFLLASDIRGNLQNFSMQLAAALASTFQQRIETS